MDDVNDDAQSEFRRIELLPVPARRRRWPDDVALPTKPERSAFVPIISAAARPMVTEAAAPEPAMTARPVPPSLPSVEVTVAGRWCGGGIGHGPRRIAAAPIAAGSMARIAVLYRIEADARGMDAAARREARQVRSRPLVAELHAGFTAQMAKLPAQGPAAEAIRYALNHWGVEFH